MKYVIFDLDGVIYRGKDPLPGATECVHSLANSGIRVGYLTNNSGRTRGSYILRLKEQGINVELHQIMTSGEATAVWLQEYGWSGKKVYVIGGEGLSETLADHGFIVDTQDEGDTCDLVIVGWDRGVNFNKITRAQHEIMVNNAKLIATNADAMFPAAGDRLLPGAGVMVKAVEVASGVTAEVIGKPRTISLEMGLRELGIADDPEPEVWVVGDRLDTDIACGKAYGAVTVLVTTGITTREMAIEADENLRPDYVIDSLVELPGLMGVH